MRGAPGRAPAPPAPPVRGAPGRGPPAPAAGRWPAWPGRSPSVRLPPGRGMPCEVANGLLPGRGGRSLSPPRPRGMPWDVANGLLPGRGPPGRGAEPPWREGAAGAAGASALGAGRAPGLAPVDGAAGAAGAAEAAAAEAEDAGAGAAGAAAAGAGASALAAGAGAAGAGALGAAGPGAGAWRAGAGLAAALDGAAASVEEAAAPGKALRSFLTTGASMVEEAERTNSPSSCSLVTASLEVIPSSFASSCTRTLATFLLSRSAPSQARTVYFLLRASAAHTAGRPIAERNKVVIVAHSSLGTHRVSISFLTRFQVGRLLLRPPECPRLLCLPLSGVRDRQFRMPREEHVRKPAA